MKIGDFLSKELIGSTISPLLSEEEMKKSIANALTKFSNTKEIIGHQMVLTNTFDNVISFLFLLFIYYYYYFSKVFIVTLNKY